MIALLFAPFVFPLMDIPLPQSTTSRSARVHFQHVSRLEYRVANRGPSTVLYFENWHPQRCLCFLLLASSWCMSAWHCWNCQIICHVGILLFLQPTTTRNFHPLSSWIQEIGYLQASRFEKCCQDILDLVLWALIASEWLCLQKTIHPVTIETVGALFCTAWAMVKKENKIKRWVHDSKDINCILKLDDQLVVRRPLAFLVLSVRKERMKGDLFYVSGNKPWTSQHLNCCFFICIQLS